MLYVYDVKIKFVSPVLATLPSTEKQELKIFLKQEKDDETLIVFIPGKWFPAVISSLVSDSKVKDKEIKKYQNFKKVATAYPLFIPLEVPKDRIGIIKQTISLWDRTVVSEHEAILVDDNYQPEIEFQLVWYGDYKPEKVKELLEIAGKVKGVGSGRTQGYGRFEVTSFKAAK